MNLSVLGSGSGGNSIAVWEGNTGVLLDCGLSFKAMIELLVDHCRWGRSIKNPEWALLISHAHLDHCLSIRKWIEDHGLPVYSTAKAKAPRHTAPATETQRAIHQSKLCEVLEMYPAAWHDVPLRKPFRLPNGWRVMALPCHHQAAGSVTYMLRSPSGAKLATFLETGSVTPEMWTAAQGASIYCIESNHDEDLLAMNQTRPGYVLDRAADGHLSNDQAEELITYLPPEAQAVVLCHLSADPPEGCNTAKLVHDMAMRATERRGSPLTVHVSTQDEPTPIVEVKP